MTRALMLWMLGTSSVALAQDTTRTASLDPVVVTAERSATPLSMTAASVTRLSGSALRRTPGATLADAMRLIPGFAVVDFDGLGRDPQLMTRGFYGGGEAEYVVVLVDGKPANLLHNGRIAWDALPPLEAIGAVEVVHGGSSPLWGDAAVGGVINILTNSRAAENDVRWSVGGGSFGALQLGIDGATSKAGHRVWGALSAERSTGFREHAGRQSTGARTSIVLADGPNGRLSLAGMTHHRRFDEPGALLDSLLLADRSSADGLFRFDNTREQVSTLGLDGERRLSASVRVSAGVLGELRDVNATRTLALAPGFGDTRERDATARRRQFTGQVEIGTPQGQLILGTDVTRGAFESRYHEVMSGTRDEYASATGSRGALSAQGDATRIAGAVFAHYGLQLSAPVRLTLGARADWLRDEFTPKVPAAGSQATASHRAFSPRAGVNVRYMESATASGHLFVAAGRSFKAPTLDQLFDQRPIPVPFPPFTVTTSNPGLAPQHGVNYEMGVQHMVHGRAYGNLRASASVYQMDMHDELDFDVATLRYVNIGRSRHRGAETGLRWTGAGPWSAYTNYTLQAATSRVGANAGKSLKAVPRQALGGGVGLAVAGLPEVQADATHARDIHLDDANTVELPAWTRIDAQLTQRVDRLFVTLQVRNVLGARVNTTGFIDPSGTGQAYFHPAAGRTLHLVIRSGG